MLRIAEKFKLPYNTAFIINPTAGGGHAGRVWPLISELLYQSKQKYLYYYTEKRGSGVALAEKAVKEGAELVVAIGGDGTLREVVNGIDLEKTLFGLLPLGTGNGFRRSCNIPGHWEDALKGLAEWQPRKIDLGKVNGSLFLNVVGVGFDAAVAAMASGKYKNIKGYMAYVAAFLEELVEFKHFTVTVQGSEINLCEKKALLAVIANGTNYGGSFSIAPQARIDDGTLDMLVARKGNTPDTTMLAVRALAGRHLSDSGIITGKGTCYFVDADHQVPVHIDGEVVGHLPVEVSVIPGALQIIAPAT